MQSPHNKPGHKPGKPNGNGNGNKGGGKGGNLRYGAFGGYKGVARSKAAGFVNADIRRLGRDTKSNVKQENRQYRRERGDIKHVYGQSAGALKALKQNTRQTYGGALADSKAAQQHLSDLLGQSNGAMQGQANSELSRLGMGGTDATSMMGADAQNAQNIANQNGADNQANLGMARANAGALGNMFMASNQGSRLSDIGQARNVRDENVAQLRDAMHEAQAGRGDAVRSLLDQMAQSGWSQHMEAAQLGIQRMMAKKGMQYYGGGSSSYTPYQSSSYTPTYGYGYSSSSGGSTYQGGGGSNYGGGYSANGAKQNLYSQLLGMRP